jgi:hypothetical protein
MPSLRFRYANISHFTSKQDHPILFSGCPVTLTSNARTAKLAHNSLYFADRRDPGAQDWCVIHRRLPDQWPMDAEVLVHQNVA